MFEGDLAHATDEELRAAVDAADLISLLPAVAHLTGDLGVLAPECCPDPAMLIQPDLGLTEAQVEIGRCAAFEALRRHRDAGAPPAPPPTPEALRTMIEYVVGQPTDEWYPVLREELALGGEDLRAPTWHRSEIAPDRPFSVAVIGAGMSGLLAAHRLGQAGCDVTVLEKDREVGGTWYENTYPGCRVDVPNHFYSYSCFQDHDWPQFFSTQPELLAYFCAFAEREGLRDRIRFETEVLEARWDDEAQRWLVATRGPDGARAEDAYDLVVSAVGQLNRPKYPDIEGVGSFEGPAFHSARWDHSIDLAGKRVAVIGTGASAVQFVPEIAPVVGELRVFQRTPPWLAPTETYHDDLPEPLRWLMSQVPDYPRWDRLWQFWRMHEGLLPAALVDPDWPDQDRSMSMLNEFVRQMLAAHIEVEFADDPELAQKMVPPYPPLAKRVVRDNGSWAKALLRDNVTVDTTGIEAITPKGIRTVDGVEHEVDVLIYGTGFTASEFLTPMKVVGREGVDLHERWGGDARAYLGLTIPDFPNLFLLYGPNTNIVINGSIIYFSECEVHYLTEAVRVLLETGHRSMDCKAKVHDAYNERIDAANRNMVWGAAEVNSWYRNAKGRVAQNWPFSLLDYWHQTRTVDPADYVWR
jgi:4-hydroxyacetophenone monooxygenase